jgi:hypothetical protein
VTHACNPSYSGGRDQEDLGSKPVQANSSLDSISKKNHHKKKTDGMVQVVGPEFKSQYHKNNKKTTYDLILNFRLKVLLFSLLLLFNCKCV